LNLSSIFDNTLKTVKSNSPEILTALGVSGVVTTAYLTGKAAVKMAQDEDTDPWMSNVDKVKRYWKLYIPAAASGALTIGCIIGASKANGRRTAAAITAYSITEKAFSEYKEKVIEQVGKGKEERIRDDLAQDRITNNPLGSREIILTSGGEVLCCELFTNRYFRSDMETLRKAMNDINVWVVNSRSATLTDFYSLIGLSPTTISDDIGWEDDRLMELIFSTTMAENNEPCLAFEYNYTRPLD
jgi:hypothetical protein